MKIYAVYPKIILLGIDIKTLEIGEIKMKKLLLLLMGIFVMLPTIASAHTELTSSNPGAGQVVKEDLNEIVLTFEGKIESLSTMKLMKDGKEISFVSVEPQDNQLVGTFSQPLENGAYKINWSIAGEDGHPLSGEIPFSVQNEIKLDQQTEDKEKVTKEPKEKEAVTKEKTKKQNAEPVKTENQTSDSSFNTTIVTLVVLIVIVFGLFMLIRRNRK